MLSCTRRRISNKPTYHKCLDRCVVLSYTLCSKAYNSCGMSTVTNELAWLRILFLLLSNFLRFSWRCNLFSSSSILLLNCFCLFSFSSFKRVCSINICRLDLRQYILPFKYPNIRSCFWIRFILLLSSSSTVSKISSNITHILMSRRYSDSFICW